MNDKYIQNYYRSLNWLKRFNYEYPCYKIVFKHHENNYFHDRKELDILDTSSIKRISGPTKPGEKNYSYGYAINSKVRLTWCSTMGYELLGHNYKCYFLSQTMKILDSYTTKNIIKSSELKVIMILRKLF